MKIWISYSFADKEFIPILLDTQISIPLFVKPYKYLDYTDNNSTEHITLIGSIMAVLKLVMGFFAVILLATVLVISFYILINNDKFPAAVVISAGGALFVDILGLIISVWKIVLNPNSITKLEPVTKIENE